MRFLVLFLGIFALCVAQPAGTVADMPCSMKSVAPAAGISWPWIIQGTRNQARVVERDSCGRSRSQQHMVRGCRERRRVAHHKHGRQ